jgi:hypothetical protein
MQLTNDAKVPAQMSLYFSRTRTRFGKTRTNALELR